MAEVLTAEVNLTVTWNHTKDIGLVPGVKAGGSLNQKISFVNGTGAAALEINEIYHAERTLAASAVENLDLAAALDNAFRTGITFNRVKALLILLPDATPQASSIIVGGVAAAGFIAPFADATDKLNVVKGGMALLLAPSVAGYPVVATTADLLKIANADAVNAATYRVLILGTKP